MISRDCFNTLNDVILLLFSNAWTVFWHSESFSIISLFWFTNLSLYIWNKKQYGKIDNFKLEYPFDYERHKRRGDILRRIIDKYVDNVVIAVSVINYSRFINDIIKDKDILAIQIQDKPENILKRLVYADEEDKIYPINISNIEEQEYYLKDIKKDIAYYKKIYGKIENKFDINGKLPEKATKELIKFIKKLK